MAADVRRNHCSEKRTSLLAGWVWDWPSGGYFKL